VLRVVAHHVNSPELNQVFGNAAALLIHTNVFVNLPRPSALHGNVRIG
jgi:hypothetical protein